MFDVVCVEPTDDVKHVGFVRFLHIHSSVNPTAFERLLCLLQKGGSCRCHTHSYDDIYDIYMTLCPPSDYLEFLIKLPIIIINYIFIIVINIIINYIIVIIINWAIEAIKFRRLMCRKTFIIYIYIFFLKKEKQADYIIAFSIYAKLR